MPSRWSSPVLDAPTTSRWSGWGARRASAKFEGAATGGSSWLVGLAWGGPSTPGTASGSTQDRVDGSTDGLGITTSPGSVQLERGSAPTVENTPVVAPVGAPLPEPCPRDFVDRDRGQSRCCDGRSPRSRMGIPPRRSAARAHPPYRPVAPDSRIPPAASNAHQMRHCTDATTRNVCPPQRRGQLRPGRGPPGRRPRIDDLLPDGPARPPQPIRARRLPRLGTVCLLYTSPSPRD